MVYVEYVPAGSVNPAGSGWGRIPGPKSPEGLLAAQKGNRIKTMPPVRNIKVVKSK